MECIGERFLRSRDSWIDLATGAFVRLHLTTSGTSDDLEWDDLCSRVASLRHPLLNPLVDFGLGPNGQRFEAYLASDSPALGHPHLPDHLGRFLRAHGAEVDEARGAVAIRRCGREKGWDSMIGLRLHRRTALDVIEEALDRMTPAGPGLIRVWGAPGSGMRTLQLLAARSARVRGFIPVAPIVAARFPELRDYISDRHICLFDDGAAPAAAVTVVTDLARASSRRHLIVRLHRTPPIGRSVALEPLSASALMRMVFVDAAHGPDEAMLLQASRAAEGNPGAFVAALTGPVRQKAGSSMVHERPERYHVTPPDPPFLPPVIAGRVLGSALRARTRAADLARRGRHAAAQRALARALRVLTGRQRPEEAAACALQLGVLALDRGATDVAAQHFLRVAELVPGSALSVLGTVAHGAALVDGNRLIEAEAVLRGALAAADGAADTRGVLAAAAGLARSLYWQGRYHDAVGVAAAHREAAGEASASARLLAILARAEGRLNRLVSAVATARESQAVAARSDDPHVAASAELALAETLHSAGDTQGAQAARARAVRLARAAHLPLFRVRAALLGNDARDHRRILALHGRRLIRLPALLSARLARAVASSPAPSAVEAVAELERLMDIAQRAADERAALDGICKAVAERLGAGAVAIIDANERTLALEGRAWRPLTSEVQQVITCGTRVAPDRCREPQEAAEPIRYGGEVVAALACRWTAGTSIDHDGAAVILKAAALSAAAPARAVLDVGPPPPRSVWSDLIGESPAAVALRESATRAARAPFPVLIEGESGAGKELVARAVHRLGTRRERRFCALNCAALTDDLVEAELFGHTRGAFTGAATERAGLFEEADGGTLFLDEVGELSARAQAKLLRVLQEGEVRRVGENLPRRVDVRVIAATNRRLEDEVAAGRFRTDLRFRLDVIRITVPPLRQRVDDIPMLAAHFWREASARVGSQATLTNEALAALARYDWPGNVRELQNVIAWIAVHSPRRGRIGASILPRHVAQAAPVAPCTFEAAREEFERRFVRAALAGANGRRARAADAMGLTRQGLAKMMRRLRIDAP